jgi:amino acid permease
VREIAEPGQTEDANSNSNSNNKMSTESTHLLPLSSSSSGSNGSTATAKEGNNNSNSNGGGASFGTATANLSKGIIGGGVVTLAFGFRETGMLLGVLLLVLFAVCTYVSTALLDTVLHATGTKTLGRAAHRLFGARAACACNIVMALFAAGVALGYCVVIVQEFRELGPLLAAHAGLSPAGAVSALLHSPRVLLVLLVCCVIVPLALQRTMSALRFVSVFALVCIVYIACVVVWRTPFAAGACAGASNDVAVAIATSAATSSSSSFTWFVWSTAMFKAMPLFCFAFICQVQFCETRAEMMMMMATKKGSSTSSSSTSRSSTSEIRGAVALSLVIALALYCVFAAFGYYTWCDAALPNTLDNYAARDALILLGRAAMLVMLAGSIPLFTHAIRGAADQLFFGAAPRNSADRAASRAHRTRQIAWTVGIVGAVCVLACLCGQLDVILGLTGALGGSALVYLIPGALYLRVQHLAIKGRGLPLNGSALSVVAAMRTPQLWPTLFVALGLAQAILCTLVIVFYK